jgi:hypothetical protein
LRSQGNENVILDGKTKFQLNFGFLHSNGTTIFPYEDEHLVGNDGLHDIVSKDTIFMERMLHIPANYHEDFANTKTIICQVKLFKSSSSLSSSCDVLENSNLSTRQVYENVLENEILTDCIVMCDNGESIKAHKLMLASHSIIFKTILQSSCEILMRDVPHKVCKEMLRFLYCRKINDFDCIALRLLKLAEKVKNSHFFRLLKYS